MWLAWAEAMHAHWGEKQLLFLDLRYGAKT